MILIGFLRFKQGYMIFSNMDNIKFPYTYCGSVDDLKEITKLDKSIKKMFLGDDFERWYNGRRASSKLNLDLNSITLDFGKCNCSLLYTCKYFSIMDMALKMTTSEFWNIDLVCYKYPVNESIDLLEWADHLENLAIQIKGINSSGEELRDRYVIRLHKWVSLYDTLGTVKNVKVS